MIRFIAVLLIFFGASFSVYAQNYVINSKASYSPCSHLSVGQVVQPAAANCYIGYTSKYIGAVVSVEARDGGNGGIVMRGYDANRKSSSVLSLSPTSQSCPSGESMNPDSGVCEEEDPEPEPCPIGYVRNELGVCVVDPEDDFCENDFLALEAEESNSCAAQHPDHFTNFSSSCKSRDEYSFSCSPGIKKPQDVTDPIDKPNGDFNGGNSGTATPDVPDFDKPEPDPVTPNPETDTALLGALTNLNRDNNQAFNSLNKDLNSGMTDIDNQLTKLNGTNEKIGQAIKDQTTQDWEIYQAQKQLALQQTGTIGEVGSSITDAVNGLGTKLDELGQGSKTSVDNGTCTETGGVNFTCSGNDYECFMAHQSLAQTCAAQSSSGTGQTDEAGFKTTLDGYGSDLTDGLKEFNDKRPFTALANEDVDIATGFNTISEANGLNFNEGCPAPRTYDYGMGSVTISYQPFCDLALYVRAMLMLTASIGSFMVVIKHM